MADCHQLIELIRSGTDGISRALEIMYTDAEFRKMARYVYQRCSCAQRQMTWEEFLTDCLLRFIDQILKGAAVRNCNLYFWGICRNYCRELCRVKPTDPLPPTDEDTQNSHERLLIREECEQLLLQYIGLLSPQCQAVFMLAFLNDQEGIDKEKLLEELRNLGYELKEGVLAAVIARCKRNLRELIGDALDDCLDD